MQIAVVGSRTYDDYEFLMENLNCLKEFCEEGGEELILVSGGAKGADSLVKRFAEEFNVPLKEYLPDWETHGKKAGFIRNKEIVDNADQVIAFWDMQSKGTLNTIQLALRQQKTVTVYPFLANESKAFDTW